MIRLKRFNVFKFKKQDQESISKHVFNINIYFWVRSPGFLGQVKPQLFNSDSDLSPILAPSPAQTKKGGASGSGTWPVTGQWLLNFLVSHDFENTKQIHLEGICSNSILEKNVYSKQGHVRKYLLKVISTETKSLLENVLYSSRDFLI